MSVTFNGKYLAPFINAHEYDALQPQVTALHKVLREGTGLGSDFRGWIELPEKYDREEFARIKAAAQKIKKDTQVFIVIGIGGSYLGSRAVIELMHSPFYNSLKKDTPDIYFVGNNINSGYLNEVLALCEGKDVSVNIISKSGTTTEPSIAFRVFRALLEKKYGKDGSKGRIYVTTDKAKGTLKKLATEEGYETFVVPDDIGGRYSVLSAVGLLPIAASGVDIDELMAGAKAAQDDLASDDIAKNDSYKYAVARNILARRGRDIEILVSYEPAFAMMNEWWKQLFGESEGKDNKGLYPASAIFSTDLHSLGQFIQQGSRTMFETVVHFGQAKTSLTIDKLDEDIDGLNFLAGKTLDYVNDRAFEGTVLAHTDGNVPNVVLEVPKIDAHEIGYLIYFFWNACAMSGYLVGINPFDQPGVESYKKNMFALLGKPGYESEKAVLEARLGR
ncbi:glucose-6-phosphate isomerase [Ethanoligenens sp.]|uniref:glucose-6-phosphate isomerase n=1 Tax=Ethanoligenens sp. TaxID=2099655 RepID=UPI0039E9E61B